MPERPSVPEGSGADGAAEGPATSPDHGRLHVGGLRWWEVADALWLARHHPELAGPRQPDVSPESAESPSEESPTGELPTPGEQRAAAPQPEPSVPEPDAAPSAPAGTASPTADGGEAHEHPLPDRLPPPGPPRTPAVRTHDHAARRRPSPRARVADDLHTARVGDALRPLRERIRSARLQELDEEATAERLAEAPGLPPAMGPGSERRWDAVLVVDAGPHMTLWAALARRFMAALRRHGGFRDLRLRFLDTHSDHPGGVSLRGPNRRSRPQPPRSLADPTGRRIVLVLTDGLGPAWRAGAVQEALAVWGRHQPVAVLQTLPQRLWHRTALDPRRVRLRASGPWAGSARVDWEFTEPSIAAPAAEASGRRRPVPVPVLEVADEWIAPWARFIAGDGPRWTEVAALLVPPCRPDPPAPWPERPRTAGGAAERVARFRVWASPEAFSLATRLAAVPLDLPVMYAVQRRTLPRTGPAHLAEFFMSDLVEPMPASGGNSFLFGRGVREELLASSTRQATEMASRIAAEVLAPHSGAARELLIHLSGGEVPREPEVTGENLRFREIEHTVLEALSGPHLRRARRIQRVIRTGRTSSDQKIDPTAREESNPAAHNESPATVNIPGMPETPVPSQQGGVGGEGALRGGTILTAVSQGATTPESGAPLDRGSSGPSTRPAIWGNMPPRNLVFTGREELLERLERDLGDGPTAVLPHALHGMGGVGKSQLALEYVYRHASRYDVVWWIPAERPTQIAQALVELAQRLRLPVTSEAITAVPAVLEALRTGNPYGNWLLVFDNAESPESVQEFFPSSPEGGPSGSILVTSRNPQWNTLAHPLEVDVFERSESIQLLQRRNPDLPEEEADQLAEVLGDLPLAVEQASAWRAETGMPAAEYLRLFEEKRAELMSVSPPTQYEQTVATAWNVSLDHLASKNPAALQLLQICAYFASEPVARSLFSGAAVEPIAPDLDRALTDPLRLGRAIREINRYSLAKIDHRNNSIQMHRLVQAVLIARMTEEQRERMRQGAHMLLAANAPRDPRDPEHWGRFADLYPHVVVSKAVESDSRNARQMIINLAQYLYFWGDHEAARDFGQQAYDVWKDKYGEGDQHTLLLCRDLWFVLWRMGRYQEAAALSERMRAEVRGLGPDAEEELLSILGQVAADRRARGDFRGSLEIAEEVYERAVRAYGDEDPLTLIHSHNLAVALRTSGQFLRAREVDQETYRRTMLLYGEEAYDSLLSEMGLAVDRREAGEYALSARMFEELVDKFRRVFGEMNPNTLRTVGRLAVSRRKAGDHPGALELSRPVRKALTERYGVRSPDSLIASLNLSVDLRQAGVLDEAMRLGQSTRERYEEVFGEDHPDTAAADVDLAITLRLLNEVDTARALNESALRRAREALGDTHPYVLIASANLASDMFAQGDAVAAAELDRANLEVIKSTLGATHPTALVVMGNLACDLRALRQTDEAETLHATAVKELQAKLGEGHPACVDAAAWRRANCDADPMPL
ncbi:MULTISPECIES: FxSxx-COOH system tetratricopeptide repeat protein [Streptomyces]|uniref:FxSxx-COOH system tetratricopeptide repeat protein n=1 Tax=Streptomyces lonegramiae TaxID=3075524 RepID=A0ABU2X980_9ACTN|nr:FxSxx-COOH system tetratricopeptide repeat protein [Streptomyces sp. DSM 41529]MDT0541937.1 FxSxx-COOH system tetratricopeptide repeat protein [Streptomyces sp. DSM 41529]